MLARTLISLGKMFYHIQQRKSLYFIDLKKKIPEALKGTGND